MRIGNFTMSVVHPDGTPFHEVVDATFNATYVVAEPGALYEVEVARLDTSAKHIYGFYMQVDGKDVGSSKVFTRGGQSSRFEGFVKQGDTTRIYYNQFKFAAAEVDADKAVSSAVFQEGRITSTVTEVEQSGASNDFRFDGTGAGPSKVGQLPEGKKFFLAPSLTTGTGGVKAGGGYTPTQYRQVGAPLAKFELRYETAATLLLRQVLRRDNPAHAAILNSFAATRAAPEAAATPRDPTARNLANEMTLAVKRERGGEGTSRQHAAVDLTGDGREQLAPGEQLVCDLTGDDAEAPRWGKRRRG